MIPVLICPVLNRFDLLERMLASVDHPVKEVIIVDNSCSGYELPSGIIDSKIGYIRPYTSIGYGGAINAGITQTAYAPWWLWSSNDLVFGKGDLDHISEQMEEADDNPIFISYGFIYGALNADTVERVGLVDDWNFFPIYEDDIDYYRRLHLGAVRIINYKGNIVHGDDGVGSLTIRSDNDAKSSNSRSHSENTMRYIEKWGGKKGQETHSTPYGTGLPLWATRPDIRGRARRMW